jgi:hypothetical protein
VFVLSPSSAQSDICAWEVAEAVGLGKRIIPVLCRSLDGVKPPQQLADLNYIFFYAEPKFPGSGFGTALNRLVDALNTDPGWLREHTRYLRLAKEREEVGKPADRRLLSAADISLAKKWTADRPEKAAPPTALQLDFIEASEAEDIRWQSAETQRLQEVAEADRKTKEAAEQAAREATARAAAETKLRTTAEQKALVEKTARANAEAAARKLRSALIAVIGTGFAAVIILLGLAVSFYEFTKAQRQLDRSNQALAESINNDLDLRPDQSLKRQRQALWKLAVAGEPTKHDFCPSWPATLKRRFASLQILPRFHVPWDY